MQDAQVEWSWNGRRQAPIRLPSAGAWPGGWQAVTFALPGLAKAGPGICELGVTAGGRTVSRGSLVLCPGGAEVLAQHTPPGDRSELLISPIRAQGPAAPQGAPPGLPGTTGRLEAALSSDGAVPAEKISCAWLWNGDPASVAEGGVGFTAAERNGLSWVAAESGSLPSGHYTLEARAGLAGKILASQECLLLPASPLPPAR